MQLGPRLPAFLPEAPGTGGRERSVLFYFIFFARQQGKKRSWGTETGQSRGRQEKGKEPAAARLPSFVLCGPGSGGRKGHGLGGSSCPNSMSLASGDHKWNELYLGSGQLPQQPLG